MISPNQIERLRVRIEFELAGLFKVVEAGEFNVAARELLLRCYWRLKAASERIEQGSFGLCCDCGREIGVEQLDRDPAAPLCGGCDEDRRTRISREESELPSLCARVGEVDHDDQRT